MTRDVSENYRIIFRAVVFDVVKAAEEHVTAYPKDKDVDDVLSLTSIAVQRCMIINVLIVIMIGCLSAVVSMRPFVSASEDGRIRCTELDHWQAKPV